MSPLSHDRFIGRPGTGPDQIFVGETPALTHAIRSACEPGGSFLHLRRWHSSRLCRPRQGAATCQSATWLTHLDLDWESPVWRHWLQALGERHTVVRYDERGCGLSDADPGEPSLETWVADLETVVDAVGVDRLALLGVSQGAGIAVSYAVRYPERVSGLVLYGGYARGRRLRGQREQDDAVVASIRAGWTRDDPTYRHVFSALFLPDGTPEQKAWYEDLLRASTSADTAVQLFRRAAGSTSASLLRR